jgi:hypothetical protein
VLDRARIDVALDPIGDRDLRDLLDLLEGRRGGWRDGRQCVSGRWRGSWVDRSRLRPRLDRDRGNRDRLGGRRRNGFGRLTARLVGVQRRPPG